MKYLYSLYDPERFDVVVFKNPRDPTINYIKRLTGLPNQMVALIDGDVFSRNIKDGEVDASGKPTMADPWALPDWHVARKPERAQRAMWQPVFSSEYTPLNAITSARRWFYSPWLSPAGSKDWQIEDRRDYEFTGTGAATRLEWDEAKRPIVDHYAYNEGTPIGVGPYPVSDLRSRWGSGPRRRAERVSAVVVTRWHEFRGDIEGAW